MRILYGVVGEGMGHAIRSRVVLDHLLAEQHEVEIVASQRAVDFLEQAFEDRAEVHRVHGLHIVTEENRVRRGKTVWQNVRDGAEAMPGQIAAYFQLIRDFQPQAVVSDFESWTYLFGKLHRLPVFSIDNMQIINRCVIPDDVIGPYRTEFEVTKAFIKSKLPYAEHYFIATFFRPEIRKDRTTLVPPILRPEIIAAKSEEGGHLLVYQTAEGNEALVKALQETGLECRIYGMRRGITEEQREGQLRYMPFSEPVFIEDLRTSRAVITGGGFTLMSECVYLHKPTLSVPITGHFEQILNGRYLEHEGYGRFATALHGKSVHAFLEVVPECRKALAKVTQDGNKELFGVLDEHLDRAAAGV
jgi:uncharacterized protein (TIGR00661 family)